MKKDLIFTPALLLVGVALFMLRATGMKAHIAVSIIGVLVLIDIISMNINSIVPVIIL